jgi:NADH-quinone oxidoreductase subunit H
MDWISKTIAENEFVIFTLIKIACAVAGLLTMVAYSVLIERKVSAFIQDRVGPNRTAIPWIAAIPVLGPFLVRLGIFQPIADGLKSFLKEDFTPAHVRKIYFWLAPAVAMVPAFLTIAVIPFGSTLGKQQMVIADLNVGVLYTFGIVSLAVYGIVLAGYAANSKYPFIGGIRSSAQMISYEIAMGLSLVAVFLYAGSMSTSQIVAAQADLWFVIPAFFSFFVYVITMVGETNRLPFDLAEGEGELTGGFHTEYGSMRFAMFFLGEYINMFTVAALATTMFLGGPAAPPGIAAINDGMFNEGWWGLLWFTAKLWMFMFVFVWLRGSLPRVRYDQFMRFGWKFLIPATLTWVVLVAFFRAGQNGWLGGSVDFAGRRFPMVSLFLVGVIAVLALVGGWLWDRRAEAKEAAAHPSVPDEIDPYAGGYPVPPLPGQRLREPSLAPALTSGSETKEAARG